MAACVSAGLRNLMFAGRSISATHIAHASSEALAEAAWTLLAEVRGNGQEGPPAIPGPHP